MPTMISVASDAPAIPPINPITIDSIRNCAVMCRRPQLFWAIRTQRQRSLLADLAGCAQRRINFDQRRLRHRRSALDPTLRALCCTLSWPDDLDRRLRLLGCGRLEVPYAALRMNLANRDSWPFTNHQLLSVWLRRKRHLRVQGQSPSASDFPRPEAHHLP